MTRDHLTTIAAAIGVCVSVASLAANQSLFLLGDWIAWAVFGVSAAALATPHRERLSALWARPATAWILASATVVWALWPVPFRIPVAQDHAHHMLNTSIFIDLLTSGHLFGWTDRVSTGLPFGDVYGTPVYIVTALGRLLTFGLMSLETSYAFGIVLVWLTGALAIVALTRRLLPGSTLAPWLAASAFVLDPGGDREGGWVYSMFHAVWPQLFATGVLCWALIALFRVAEKPTTRRLGLAVLATGAAFWMHPMNAMNLIVASPLIIGVHLVHREGDRTPGAWLIAAFAGAAVIGWGWLSHLFTARDAMEKYVAYGTPLDQMGVEAWSGFFENGIAPLGILGLFGLAFAIAKRTRFSTFVVMAFSAYVLLASLHIWAGFDLGIADSNSLFMWRRFVITAKPLWFAMVGTGAALALIGLRNALENQVRETSFAASWAGATPVVVAVVYGAWVLVPGPAARPMTAESIGISKDLVAVENLLAQLPAATIAGETPRVAYWHDRGDQGDYLLIPFASAGFGYVPTRIPPCQTYEHTNKGRDLETLKLLGVTHVFGHRDLKLSGAKKVGDFGRFTAYELGGDAPARHVQVNGKASAEVQEWSPLERRVRVVGLEKGESLLLDFPPYAKWHASIGGKPVKLELAKRAGFTLSKIEGPLDGELIITFEDTLMERASFVFALLVILAMVGLVVRERELPALGGEVVGPRLQYAVLVVLLVAPIPALLVARHVGEGGRDDRWLRGESKDVEVADVLHAREPDRFTYEPHPYCVRPFDRRPRAGCYEEELEPRLRLAKREGRKFPSCMEVGVPDKGSARVEWATTSGRVKGKVHLDKGVKATLVEGDKRAPIADGKFFSAATDGSPRIEFSNRSGTAKVCIEAVVVAGE